LLEISLHIPQSLCIDLWVTPEIQNGHHENNAFLDPAEPAATSQGSLVAGQYPGSPELLAAVIHTVNSPRARHRPRAR